MPRKVMRGDALVDLRNVYAPALAEAAGFAYRGVGRAAKARTEDAALASPHAAVGAAIP